MFYSPLKNSIFRAVWIVIFFSNIGTWIHTVTSSILITKLTHSTILIALIQTAAVLPIFIFSIPAGVLADFLDKKRIVIMAQSGMAIVAFIMAIITFSGGMSPYLLIGTTFLLNIGFAFNVPAWQSISSTLVPKQEIKQAAALNNLSFNLSRFIGPAIAGYYFSKLGAGFLFILNGISFVAAILVLNNKLTAKVNDSKITVMQLYKGFIEGFLCYKKYPEIKFIFLKAIFYFLFSSSIWALLPYIIIIHNKMPDKNLGLLTGMAGLGAMINAYSIYYLRKKFVDNQLTTFAMLLSSLVIMSIGYANAFNIIALIMLIFGISWSIAISVFNGIFQSEFPIEIRSRIIGIYFVCFAGAQSIGGYLSGVLVHNIGLEYTLMFLATCIFVIFGCYLLIPLLQNKNPISQYEN